MGLSIIKMVKNAERAFDEEDAISLLFATSQCFPIPQKDGSVETEQGTMIRISKLQEEVLNDDMEWEKQKYSVHTPSEPQIANISEDFEEFEPTVDELYAQIA